MNTPAPGELEATGLLGMLKTLRTGVRSPLADLFPEPPSNKINSKNANAKPVNANAKPANANAKPVNANVKSANANAKPANANAKPANANSKNANANVDPKSAKGGRKNKTRKSSKRASRKRRVH